MNNLSQKLAPLALGLLMITACDQAKPTPAADARPRVLVSNPPTAWLVKQIAGDKVIVQTLASGGGCGHEYQPTDKEIAEAGKAEIWFQAGLEFESANWAKQLQEAKNYDEHKVVFNICRPNAFDQKTSTKSYPHYWLSFKNLEEIARNVDATYVVYRLTHVTKEETIKSPSLALQNMRTLLSTRHAHLTQLLAPLKSQTFLADHPAYTYFASDYGLKQIAVEEDGHEPSDADIARVIDKAKAAGVKVMLLSSEGHRAEAEAVAKAVGAQVVLADPNSENTPELLEMMANALVKAHGSADTLVRDK